MSLATARGILHAAAERDSAVLVGLSGGKDSLVVLDLCMQAFRRVEAFYMALLPGLEIIERSAIEAARRSGVVLHWAEHPMASQFRKNAVLRFHDRQHWDGRARKQLDVERDMRVQTGIRWIAYGHRQNDSTMRRAMLRRIGTGIDDPGSRLYPIWDWPTSDVVAYLRARKIPIPARVGHERQGGTSGLSLTEQSVLWLSKNAPEDFKRLETEYPFLGVWAARRRFAEADARPEVRDGPD